VDTLLKLTDISKSYAGVRALEEVSFDLRPGEVHAIVGENGAGKSTLIKIITGAIEPDAGSIELFGRHIERLDPLQAREWGVAAIYQQPRLFPDLSVMENLALGLEPSGPLRRVRWSERRERAKRLLKAVGAAIDPEAEASRLSMPERQLVEIARAVGSNARILIMDEPTAALGERETEQLFRLVHELKSQGVGIISISHRLEELPRVADRVTALRDGRRVGSLPIAEADRATLIRLMVGRSLESVFPKRPVEPGAVVLATEGLGRRASGVRDVSLEVRSGEILGLAGLVGAGRTELARILFGLTPADAGTIRLKGRPVTIDSPREAVDRGIAYVPEDRSSHGVIPPMSVEANITLSTLRAVSEFGCIVNRKEQERAERFVRRLRVKTSSIDAPVATLSGGNQQKVALARWLAAEPSVLILDEPTQGIDVASKAEIHELMGELAEAGLAILLISSELPEILGVSDRIAVMSGGTIVGTLDRAEADAETVLRLALGHQPERSAG